MYPLVEDLSEIYALPLLGILLRIYAIFCLPLGNQPKAQHNRGARRGATHWGRAPLLLFVEPWLITQWQTEKLNVLLAEDGHIF